MQAAIRPAAVGRAFAQIAPCDLEFTALHCGLHAHPEIGFEEVCPSAPVQEALRACGINSPAEAWLVGGVAEGLVGAWNVHHRLKPSMGAEDFSFMQHDRPGACLRLGLGMGGNGGALHNSRCDFNDDILTLGAALHASLVERAMPLPDA